MHTPDQRTPDTHVPEKKFKFGKLKGKPKKEHYGVLEPIAPFKL